MGSQDSLVLGPALDAIYLPWMNDDLRDLNPLVGILESLPVGHRSATNVSGLLGSKLVALSWDIYASHYKHA